jgi:aquaporin Z
MGVAVAFLAEFVIAFFLMLMVLYMTNTQGLASFTGVFVGVLAATFRIVESPYSGFSMNPARSFASALPAELWTGFWVYMIAPPLGMLLAAELYLKLHGIHAVICAKLYHQNTKRCIFHCGYQDKR